MTALTLLIFLLLFQLKHLVADFMLQSGWIVRNKGVYGHPGGLVHAGLHAALTFPVLLLVPLGAGVAALIALGEFVVHYHIDLTKDRVLKRLQTTPAEWRFWVLTGADQFAHQVTYLAILALVLWIA